MARDQATTTISPTAFAIGAPVMVEDAQAVIKQLNWSYGHRTCQLHVSQATGDAGWVTGGVGTTWIKFRALSAGSIDVIKLRIRLAVEDVSLVCAAECNFASGETGEVKFTVGSASATIAFDNGDNGAELPTTLTVAAIGGTGWQDVTIAIETTAGNVGNDLRYIRLQTTAITSALPAPLNE